MQVHTLEVFCWFLFFIFFRKEFPCEEYLHKTPRHIVRSPVSSLHYLCVSLYIFVSWISFKALDSQETVCHRRPFEICFAHVMYLLLISGVGECSAGHFASIATVVPYSYQSLHERRICWLHGRHASFEVWPTLHQECVSVICWQCFSHLL